MINKDLVIAEKDMEVLGIKIKKGTQVKKLTDNIISLTEVIQIGYYDSIDVLSDVKRQNEIE